MEQILFDCINDKWLAFLFLALNEEKNTRLTINDENEFSSTEKVQST